MNLENRGISLQQAMPLSLICRDSIDRGPVPMEWMPFCCIFKMVC